MGQLDLYWSQIVLNWDSRFTSAVMERNWTAKNRQAWKYKDQAQVTIKTTKHKSSKTERDKTGARVFTEHKDNATWSWGNGKHQAKEKATLDSTRHVKGPRTGCYDNNWQKGDKRRKKRRQGRAATNTLDKLMLSVRWNSANDTVSSSCKQISWSINGRPQNCLVPRTFRIGMMA